MRQCRVVAGLEEVVGDDRDIVELLNQVLDREAGGSDGLSEHHQIASNFVVEALPQAPDSRAVKLVATGAGNLIVDQRKHVSHILDHRKRYMPIPREEQ